MKGFLLRWHRRIGLMAMAFIAVVSVTGIALNHTAGLGLVRTVHHPWLLGLYGIETPAVAVIRLGEAYILHDGVDRLYRDTRELATCSGTWFGGAVRHAGGWFALCGDELLSFDVQDRLVERIGAAQGLPTASGRLGQLPGGVAIRDGQQAWQVDSDRLAFTPLAAGATVEWSAVAVVPRDNPGLPAIPAGSTLTLEQVLLDLHSGRLFGRLTVWLMDLSAVAMLVLALSGMVIWWTRRPRC